MALATVVRALLFTAFPGFYADVLPSKATSEFLTVKSAGVELRVHMLISRPSRPSQGLVILLHGSAFSADTWNTLGTLDHLSALGFTAVAIDLPGYGQYKSGRNRQKAAEREVFLQDFLASLPEAEHAAKVAIVAASMGGGYANPFVAAHPTRVAGYVPIAAVLSHDQLAWARSQIPALILWGEKDSPDSARAEAYKRLFPRHTFYIFPHAPHPCYLSNPPLFNRLLAEFFGAGPPGSAGGGPLRPRAEWRR